MNDSEISVTVAELLQFDPLVAGFLQNESLVTSYFCLTFDAFYEFKSNQSTQKPIAMILLDETFDVQVLVSLLCSFKITSKEKGVDLTFSCPGQQELNVWKYGFKVAIKASFFSQMEST